MSIDIEQVKESVAPGRKDEFLERLAEKLGMRANAATVFAAPVERDGVTVIPVAKARWGLGGGGGKGKEGDEGSGGGGGVMVSPVGYIELKGGESHFRPIHDPASRLPLLVAGGVVGLLLLGGLRRLTRRP